MWTLQLTFARENMMLLSQCPCLVPQHISTVGGPSIGTIEEYKASAVHCHCCVIKLAVYFPVCPDEFCVHTAITNSVF